MDEFLEEAINIGDQILNFAKYDDWGTYWQTLDHEGKLRTSGNIYVGNSGILLFLIDLYEQTSDNKYLEYILASATWIAECAIENRNRDSYNFYCGIGGIAYTLVRVSELTENKLFGEHALKIMSNANRTSEKRCDLLTGDAGLIIVLLKLYFSKGRLNWVLENINNTINSILSKVVFSKKGFTWDRSSTSITGLCGFAHGNSGIGFTFLELYKCFDNEIFKILAEQAFLYEDQFWNENKLNWPDFRIDSQTSKGMQDLINAYQKKNQFKFTNPNYMSAWCHGAWGIGTARIRAYKITNEKKYLEHYNNAVKNFVQYVYSNGMNSVSFTLCHGLFGGANMLIEGYNVTNNEYLFNIAKVVGKLALKAKKENGFYLSGYSEMRKEDISLFMGSAGIGHFFLRLSNPKNTESILSPSIKNGNKRKIFDGFDPDSVFTTISKKNFNNINNSLSEKITIRNFDNKKSILTNICYSICELVDNKKSIVLKRKLDVDLKKIEMQVKFQSDVFIYIKYLNATNKIESYLHNKINLLNKKVITNSGMFLSVIIMDKLSTEYIVLIPYHKNGVMELSINKFSYDILCLYLTSTSVNLGILTLAKNYKIEANKLDLFSELFLEQLLNCLKRHLLFIID